MVSSIARSFSRSGGLQASSSNFESCILLDAALERCGNAPSQFDSSAVASAATCCDTELAKLAQACWTCSKPEADATSCAVATLEADVAIGMSTCGPASIMPAIVSQHQPRLLGTRNNSGSGVYRPSTLFLVTFFVVVGVSAIGCLTLVLHRCRKSLPYQKRANRRANLDLMEGFTPVEERVSASPAPWVNFQTSDVLPPPPAARSHNPSPEAPEMLQVRSPLSNTPSLRVVLSSKTRVPVLASPLDNTPVPIQRY